MASKLGEAGINALKGSLIGAANTIPGVSGGTIAVITRIYDRLIGSVSGFFRTGWKENALFLAPVAIGAGIGIVVFARLVEFFLASYPELTAFFFIGLILGSLPFLARVLLKERPHAGSWIGFAAAFTLLLVAAIVGRPPETDPITELTAGSALLIFLAGVISSATMVVPGVSGSFVLLLIGMYSTFLRAVTDLDLAVLAVLLPGLAVGIVLVSKLINFLLTRHHTVSYSAILGLVLGSVLSIWPRTDAGWYLPSNVAEVAGGVAVAAVGFALAYFLGHGRRNG